MKLAMPWSCFLDVKGTSRKDRVRNLAAKGREQSTLGEDWCLHCQWKASRKEYLRETNTSWLLKS